MSAEEMLIQSSAPPQATAQRKQFHAVLLAGLGTFLTLAVVGLLASQGAQPWVLGSFGASCVLLFGFPDGPFSQPRNIIGGHVLTSLIGLVFLHLFGPGWLPMSAAAACALMAMMTTRTVHPPAGSNPVIVFMTVPGWSFLLLPTLMGACAITFIGWIYWSVSRRESWPRSWR